MNGLYTPTALRQWDTATEINGRWIPARPLTLGRWRRFKLAWGVLTGRYDALDWEDAQQEHPDDTDG